MSFNTFGKLFRFTTWGESHGPALGCVVDGCPPNIPLKDSDIQKELNRRKPGQSKFVTQRKESDTAHILSGVFEGKTTGTPISLVIYNEDQKSKYVPKLASGEWFGSYCLTEPGAGSDANSGKTLAKLSDDKKYYLISGQKIWISNAGFAKLFIVFARIEDDKNITSFLVPYDPKNGITLGEEEKK